MTQNQRNVSDFRLKTILWSVIVLMLLGLGWLTFIYPSQFNNLSAASAVNQPAVRSLAVDSPPKPETSIPLGSIKQPKVILFMGTDVVYEHDHSHVSDSLSYRGNSDTMILAFLNPDYNTVSLLHIPRDTEAYVGKYGIRKINSANVLGGPELAKETVSSLLDVNIDNYMVMNVHALVDLVNELGGITVNVPKKMNYMDWTAKLKIDLEPGLHTINGNQAMGFVRFRHDGLGDIGRIQRQQIFLQAVVRKTLDPLSWLHFPKLVEIAQNNIQTDMSNLDIFETLNFVHSVPHENIKFVMLPGDFAANGDWIANTNGKVIAQQLAYPDKETPVSRRNTTVCIINASSHPTLGSRLTTALRDLGYITCIGKDENEPATGPTRIIAQNGNIICAKMMQQDLGNIGEVVNASVGNLTTSITLVAHDDINLDTISMSSPDAPYQPELAHPKPLVVKPMPMLAQERRASSSAARDLEIADKETSTDEESGIDENMSKDSVLSPINIKPIDQSDIPISSSQDNMSANQPSQATPSDLSPPATAEEMKENM